MFLIPWLDFFTLWAVLYRYGWGLRLSFLAAQVINGVLIVFVTEALSVFQALTFWPLAAFWSLVLLINLILLYRLRRRPLEFRRWEPLDAVEITILAAVGFIMAVTGLTALLAPPNDNDSMIYHMARVAHWAFNGTVANYPSNLLRQLSMLPYGEYAVLQDYILSGSDRLANLVQWSSLAGSLAGVSLLAQMLGGSRRVQLFAVLFAATVPMAIAQASSTQNDLVATLWVLGVAVFSLLLKTTGKRRWGVLCAVSFALATMTKGTAMLLGAPLLLWALLTVRRGAGDKFRLLLGAVLVTVVLNAGFLYRMTQLSPDPFRYMAKTGRVVVDVVDFRGLVSNTVRGMATELIAPVSVWKDVLYGVVGNVHNWLGISVEETRYLFPESRFVLVYWPYTEDLATSYIHALLYLLAAVVGLFILTSRYLRRWALTSRPGSGKTSSDGHENAETLLLSVMALFMVSILLFGLLIKWQPYIARFHLPFFVLFAAPTAVLLSRSFSRGWAAAFSLVGGWMFILALLPLFFNQQRPVLSSWEFKKSALASRGAVGGAIYGWLMQNGFLYDGPGGKAYLNEITPEMWSRLRSAYPAEFEHVRAVLRQTPSYPGGIFFTSREELTFGGFGKIARAEVGSNIRLMRQYLDRDPGCKDIGYFTGPVQYEYPLWSLLRAGGRDVRIEHIQVDNESGKLAYPRGEPEPCLILIEGMNGQDTIEYHGRHFRRNSGGPYQIYIAEERSGLGMLKNNSK